MYYIHLKNLNHFLIKQLTLAATKMFRLTWLNEKNYPRDCLPIHLSKTCTLHFFEIENKQNMPSSLPEEMEEQIIVLKCSKYFNDGELKQLPYNIICNLFSLCILLNCPGIWKINMWYNKGIFKDFLEYCWVFEYFRKKQFLPHGRHAKTSDRFCRITTAYLGRRRFNFFDCQKKRIK